MVKLQGEVCATHRKLCWKLMTVMAIASLAAGCANIGKKHTLTSQLSSINYARQAQRPPLKPTHPLYLATTHWAGKHQKNPQDPTAALSYARNLKALGSREKALDVLARTYQLNPGHSELASEYGRMALSLGKVQLAEQLLNEASKDKRREDWKLLSALGTVNAKRGDHKKAQSYYLAALRKKPGATSVYNNLALSYALDGRAGDAETLLKKAISKGHNTPRVRQNLALVLGLQTKFGEATQMARADLSSDKAASDADYLKNMVKRTQIAIASKSAGKAKPKIDFTTTAALPAAKKTTRKGVKSAATANKRAGKLAGKLPWHKHPAGRKAIRTAQLTSTTASKAPRAGATSWSTTVSQGSTARSETQSGFEFPDNH
ncbi:MAG: tetratricopeptide repeat protein [Proteobacteria bacterium]|nr:tetratricopeptide repeat protein [Pseudomonadota bacterium]